jgi:proline iminopeptidase
MSNTTPPRLVCREQGEGSPLVLLPWGPGSFGSLYPWAFQPLTKAHRLIHWDYRGCGESSPAERYSLQDDAWDLLGLIESLKLDHPILLGHSYGGMVALAAALEQPELLGGLILANTMATSKGLLDAQKRRKERMTPRVFLRWQRLGLAAIAGEASGEDKLRYLELEARNWAENESVIQMILRRLRINFEVLARVQPTLQAFDVTSRLGEVTLPTLILAGGKDLIAGEHPRDLHLALEGSHFHRFLESGHFPFLEQPEAFFQVVSEWLEDQSR